MKFPFGEAHQPTENRSARSPLINSFDNLLNRISVENLYYPVDFEREMTQTPDTTVFCASPEESQLYVRVLGTVGPVTWTLDGGEPIAGVSRYFKIHLFTASEGLDKPLGREQKLKFMAQVTDDLQSLFTMLQTMLESYDPKVFGKCPQMILAVAPHLSSELTDIGFDKITGIVENGKLADFSDKSWYALRVDSPTVEAALKKVKESHQRISQLIERVVGQPQKESPE